MKILVLAPIPFYQERGTPIAVDLLLRSLSQAGHEVDAIVYGEGEDRQYPGVTIHRIRSFFCKGGIRPGFSLKKIYCDIYLAIKFIRLFFSRRYDVVHAVEESVFIAMTFCPLFRIPYIYDMDSSMVTQILDKFKWMKPLEKPLRFIESLPVRGSKIVVPCCDALGYDIQKYRKGEGKPVIVLKDISLLDKNRITPTSGINVKQFVTEQLNPPDPEQTKIVMYIGNLESYQGVDLMLEGFARSLEQEQMEHLVLVIVGGEEVHIDLYRKQAEKMGIAHAVCFMGRQPVADLYALMMQADALISPRIQGVNTPMKVYSYLDSGVPVVATRLPTHTQVMNDSVSCLVEPDAVNLAQGIRMVLTEEHQARQWADNAVKLIESEHSYAAFDRAVNKICRELQA